MTFEVRWDGNSQGATVKVGPFEAWVGLGQFNGELDDASKRALFRRSVKRINVEIFAYCNRRCGFCPNRDGGRMKTHALLPRETFERIVRDLESIEYDKPFFFHLYNEPLAEPDILFERIAFARPRLPKSTFSITTNGDYLSAKMFDSLAEAGVNRIFVSVYGPGQGQWNEPYIKNRVREVARIVGLDAPLVEKPDEEHRIAGRARGIDITIAGQNLWDSGYDRGGLVPELALNRSSPCLAPISDVNVDYRGHMLPCCNVYTDNVEHHAYTFGNLNETDIFSAYAGIAAQRWKLDLLKFDPGGSLCGKCSRGNDPTLDCAANRSSLEELRAALAYAEQP